MNTYLLTWNPSRTPEGSDYADMLLNSIGQTVTWACMTRQIKIGDMVFLARLGVESQGIVASGIVTEESFLGEGWSDTSKQQPFIEFKLDEFRPACSDGLLPILLLKSVFPDQQWSPQGSGIEISSEISNELKALWDKSRGQQVEMPDINNLQEKEQIPMLPDSINTILYGPPGTGKTYKTIELAVKASEPSFEPSFELSLIDKRTAIKEKYDELVKAGRIQFITFHQSFSYEEFIEGIRAETQEGTVYYEVKSGAFKEICERASDAEKVFVKINPTETNRANTHLSFDEAIEAFETDLAGGTLVELQTQDRGKSFRVQCNSSQTLQVIPNATGLSRDVPIREILLFHDEKKLLDESRHQSYIPQIYAYIQETYLQPSSQNQSNISSPSTTVAKPNFVLIIDEINRGNISKIFGELITLIEPSKRKGQKEALSVQLPYSKKSFSVPSNLHIIGTMNTADRSLALIDTALRRRFVFTEMMPEYEALKPITIEGINLGALLYTMNQRIECLYDREHTLGHAFFLPILQEDESERMEALGKVMCHKILPLLQEYFFEDWEKIRLVLGDNQKKNDAELQFVREIPVTSKVLFGNTDDEYESNAKCYTVNHKAFYNPDAYLGYTDTVSPTEAESE